VANQFAINRIFPDLDHLVRRSEADQSLIVLAPSIGKDEEISFRKMNVNNTPARGKDEPA
jgi:hypothetical protein